MKYIYDRLREASTWRGIIALATGMGVVISPEMIEYIVGAGMSLAGILGALSKDKIDKMTINL